MGSGEEFESDLFQHAVQNRQVVLDIGANVGYYTLLAARNVAPTGTVYAFEPDPTNFDRLRENVAAYHCRNVLLVQSAVAAQSESVILFVSPTNSGDHWMGISEPGRRGIPVQGISLDEFFSVHPAPAPVDVIKIDIQGAEMLALQGMEQMLRRSPSLVMFSEFWPLGLSRFGFHARDYLLLLRRHGFQLYEIDEGSRSLRLVADDELLQRYTTERGNYTNLLCTRRSLNRTIGRAG
jgi:FkbM family methyltransferase